jgi:hypothetical protein
VSVSPDTQSETSCCIHHRLSHDDAGCTIGGCRCNPTTFGAAVTPTVADWNAAHVAHKCFRDRYTGDQTDTCTAHDLLWPCDDAAVTARALAEQRRAIHARYEQLAKWADQQADSREHFAKVDPSYRGTLIPYRVMAERIRMAANQ